MTGRIAGALAFVLLASACLVLRPPADASAQHPMPDMEHFPVRWLSAENPLGLDAFGEGTSPFRVYHDSLARPEIGPPVWGAYLIDDANAGQPREVLASDRELHGLGWQDGSLTADFATMLSGHSGLLQQMGSMGWKGSYRIDLASGKAEARFDDRSGEYTGLGFNVDSSCSPNRINCFRVDASPLSPLFLTSSREVPTGTLTHYVTDRSGLTRVLNVIPAVVDLRLSPDGSFLYHLSDAGELVIVPTGDGTGWKIRNVTNYAVRQVPGSDGRLFFATSRGGTDCCFRELYVYYHYSHTQNAIVHIGAGELDRLPTQLTWVTPHTVSNATQRVDTYSGAITLLADEPKPAPQSPTTRAIGSTLHDRYELRGERVPFPAVPQEDCRLLPRRLYVIDNQTGVETTLFECPTGGPSWAHWLDDETVLVEATTSSCCHGSGSRYLLLKLRTGELFAINDTNGREHQFYVSPDGSRILIKAERLIVYNFDAEVVRDYGPAPEGWQYHEAAWSPDSRSIAFILEPANWPHPL